MLNTVVCMHVNHVYMLKFVLTSYYRKNLIYEMVVTRKAPMPARGKKAILLFCFLYMYVVSVSISLHSCFKHRSKS